VTSSYFFLVTDKCSAGFHVLFFGKKDTCIKILSSYFEHNNEPFGSIKVGELFGQLNDYHVLKDSAPWSESCVICISYVTTIYGRRSRNFVELRFEIWQY
jgi:hypothetical protein